MIFGLGSSLGRFLAGLIYDLAGSYTPALIGAALALVAAVILVNRLGSYLYPVQRDIAPALAPARVAS
jgi:cyanate permease